MLDEFLKSALVGRRVELQETGQTGTIADINPVAGSDEHTMLIDLDNGKPLEISENTKFKLIA